MGEFRWAACIAVTVALATAPAVEVWAQPESDRQQAQEHWRKARIHYDLAEWDRAIEELKAGYKLMQEPDFLFNIAQAYRLKGDCDQALVFYDTYRRATTPADRRRDLDALMTETRACIDKGGAAPADRSAERPELTTKAPVTEAPPPSEPPPVTRPTPAPVPAPLPVTTPGPATPRDDDRPRSRRWIAIASGGAGVAMAVTGAVFHVRARSAAADIDELGRTGGVFDDEYQALEARGRRDGRIAASLYVGGAVGIAAGAALWFLGGADGASSVTIVPTSGGTRVSWCGRF